METSLRWHDINRIANSQITVGPSGKNTILNILDADAQFTVIQAGTNGIRPPDLFIVDSCPERQVLALGKDELFGQFGRDIKCDHDGVISFRAYAADVQGMKLGTQKILAYWLVSGPENAAGFRTPD
jgi:hypothetical protein